jgi:hypothetical protein
MVWAGVSWGYMLGRVAVEYTHLGWDFFTSNVHAESYSQCQGQC